MLVKLLTDHIKPTNVTFILNDASGGCESIFDLVVVLDLDLGNWVHHSSCSFQRGNSFHI